MEVEADLGGDSFYEVTFQAKIGDDPWEPIGTDDNAPYRVFHDVYALEPGTSVHYRAVVLDNAGHTRESAARSARVGEPRVSVAVAPGARTEIRVTTNPELSHYVVTVQRKVGDGPWTAIGSDDSSPVYTVFDTPTDGAVYRAVLDYGSGTVTSAEASAPPPAIVHYRAPGRRLRRLGRAPVRRGGRARRRTGPRRSSARRRRLRRGLRGGDRRPDQAGELHRPPAGRGQRARPPASRAATARSSPPQHNEIWLKQGDPTVYFSPPG